MRGYAGSSASSACWSSRTGKTPAPSTTGCSSTTPSKSARDPWRPVGSPGMVHRSDPYFLVLHALKLKGFAENELVAEVTSLAADEVDGHLASARSAGEAQRDRKSVV